jgi:apolipoprotein N-acyltransferase
MSFSMWMAHIVRVRSGNISGIISLISFWLVYEFISLNISIISPWLNLGNGLSKDLMFIQWYEITGTSGGSLWILTSNVILTLFIINYLSGKTCSKFFLYIWLSVIIIPSGYSIYRYHTIKENNSDPTEVLVIQPNIDPYTEKFRIPFEDQLKKVITMAAGTVTNMTSWIITPETTVDDPVDLNDLENNKYLKMINVFLEQYPGVSFISGLVSYRVYPESDIAPTRSARITDSSGLYSDHFNSAFKLDTGKYPEVYHKSKLVPGIEMQFTNGPGRVLSKILPFLGGTKWGYGTQKERICFEHSAISQKIAPVICYESVFGRYVTGYVKEGAEALFIITNDGWWKNTNGYKQHLAFASIRAIESRRPVVRAGNTGVSCIINIKGMRTKETKWWAQTVMRGEINPETRVTPYVKYGDYIMQLSILISIVILIRTFIFIPFRKKKRIIDNIMQPL